MPAPAVAQASQFGVGQSGDVAAADNGLDGGVQVQIFRIDEIIKRLSLYAFGHKSNGDEFYYLCLSLSKGIDFAIINHVVPLQARQLPSMLKQVCQYQKDPCLLAAIMVLMISVRNACGKGWFSDRDSEELIGLTTELGKTYGSSQGLTVEPPSFNEITSTIMSRFYPRLKMDLILAYMEVKPGFDAYVIDILALKDVKAMYPRTKVRLFVAQTDNIETSSCLVTPTKVNFLVNGTGVEKRTNVFMDPGPQLPTPVTQLMRYGSNVLQAIGEFNGNYVIAVALMSEIPNPDSNVLADYEQHLPATAESDFDIIEGPSRVSVNCPISFSRIKTPVKGHLCKHIQCFDYENYVDINSRRPSWRCPHCNQYLCFTDIRVDRKMVKILKNVETNVSDIIVSSDGSWNAVTKSDEVIQKPEHVHSAPVDGESPQPMDFMDLTQTDDDGLDALNPCETEDTKLFQASSQSQFIDQITAVDPLTNNVLQNRTYIEDGFWSAIYRSTLGQGPANPPSHEQTTHASVACSSSISLIPVSTESIATAMTRQPGVPLAGDPASGSFPQRGIHSLPQQYHSWDQTTIHEYGRFPSMPQHITRTPIAVQALPVQTSAASRQLPNGLPDASQVSPPVPSISNSFLRANSLQAPRVSSSSQPNHVLPSSQPQQHRGLISPTQHMMTPPVLPHVGRLSPGPTSSSMQTSAGISLSQGHPKVSPNGNARPVPTGPAIGVPLTILNSGQGPGMPPVGGDQMSNVSIPVADDSYDLGDPNWRPSSRMRGAISGQAYLDMLNQFIIKPTQEAQMLRPLSNAAQSFIADGTASTRPVSPAGLSNFVPGRPDK